MTPETLAQLVLKDYWDKQLPVKAEDIAKAAGIAVKHQSCIDGNQNISGKFSITSEHKRGLIEVNALENQKRQNFTIAHELGHCALGHGQQVDGIYRDTTNPIQEQIETEANRFAAELIMPADHVNFFIFQKGINNVHDLAELFNVSEIAMNYRLINLGII